MEQVLDQKKIIEELNEVLQIDVDAIGAYQSAINAIAEPSIKLKLEEFKSDHERHVTDLRAIVQRSGGKPDDKPDLRGALRKGMTALAGLIGAEAVLRAMLSNERVTNDIYARHVQKSFPPDILDVLRRNYGDEQRHYSWIDLALRQRMWEQSARPIAP